MYMGHDGDYSKPWAISFNNEGNLMVGWHEKEEQTHWDIKGIGVYDGNKNRIDFREMEGIGSGQENLYSLVQTLNGYYWTAGNSYKIYWMESLQSDIVLTSTDYQYPRGMQYANDGNIYGIYNWPNGGPVDLPGIFKIDQHGNVTTHAELDEVPGWGGMSDLAVDSEGNIYFTDFVNDSIWKYSVNGILSIFADGSNGLLDPVGIDFDLYGNLFVTNSENSQFYEISSTIVGFDSSGQRIFIADRYDGVNDPSAIEFDAFGNLFFTDSDGIKYISVNDLPNENQPPIADAGLNISISSENQATTALQGTASDPDGDTITYRWLEGATELSPWRDVVNGEAYLNLSAVPFFDTGQHTLTLEVSDGTDTVTDDMILTVDNSPPHAAPSGSGVYEINTEVILGGSVSDFDGDTLYYEWMEGTNVLYSGSIDCIKGGTPVELPIYSIWNLNLGVHAITLQVDDGVNEPVSSDITVEIVDTGVPTLAPVCNQLILWPPNHRMVEIYIEANASDDSGLPVTLDTEVTCDEPEDGLGDGDMSPDWTDPIIYQETGIIELQLRAERSGNGEGREYNIAITAYDTSGNSSTANLKIIVPHDRRKK